MTEGKTILSQKLLRIIEQLTVAILGTEVTKINWPYLCSATGQILICLQ